MSNFSGSDIQKHSYVYQVIQDILDKKKIKVSYTDKGKKITKQVLLDPKGVKGWLNLSKEQIDKKLHTGLTFFSVFNILKSDISIKWTQIDKSKYSGMIRKGDAKSTKAQEDCSLFIIKKVYENKSYSLSDLKKIYPDIINNPDWILSFEAQKEVFKKIKQKEFNGTSLKFDRDSQTGFMQFITKLVKKFGISKKDTWNPADIWLYKEDVKKKLQDAISIEDLNNRMCKLFDNKELLGISLKKTGKIAKYELTNFKKVKQTQLTFITGNVLLNLNSQKTGFVNDELNFDNKYTTNEIVKSQVRMYPKISDSNVQISCKISPKTKVELGKVPAVFRNKIYKEITSLDFPTGKKVPLNKAMFIAKQNEYVNKFKLIKTKGIINLGVNSSDEFVKNVLYLYDNAPKSYHEMEMVTKFQGLELAYGMSKISKKSLDSLTTKWIYLSQKKGTFFGPFIKVYLNI